MEKTRNIKVQAKFIAMLAPFISREETRYYLNGIFISPHRERGRKTGVFLVATDGHHMGIIYDKDGETNGDWVCPIPRTISTACKKSGNESSGLCHFIGNGAFVSDNTLGARDPAILSKSRMASEYAPPIDGNYPKWQTVLPKQSDHGDVAVAYNPSLLADFLAVSKIARVHPCVTMTPSKDGGPSYIFVQGVPEFVGVQMPMRGCASSPDWLGKIIEKRDKKKPAKPKPVKKIAGKNAS